MPSSAAEPLSRNRSKNSIVSGSGNASVYDLSVIDQAYGPHADLYNDVLKVDSLAETEEIQAAFFDRRSELFGILSSLENATDAKTLQQRIYAERRMDAIVVAFRILKSTQLRGLYQQDREERMAEQSYTRHLYAKSQQQQQQQQESQQEALYVMEEQVPYKNRSRKGASKQSPRGVMDLGDAPRGTLDRHPSDEHAHKSNRGNSPILGGAPFVMSAEGSPLRPSSLGSRGSLDSNTVEDTLFEDLATVDNVTVENTVGDSTTRDGDTDEYTDDYEDEEEEEETEEETLDTLDDEEETAEYSEVVEAQPSSKRRLSRERSRHQSVREREREREHHSSHREHRQSHHRERHDSRRERKKDLKDQGTLSTWRSNGIANTIKEEVTGAIQDTTSAFDQVFNAFTLTDKDIDAVTGRIEKAKKQYKRS